MRSGSHPQTTRGGSHGLHLNIQMVDLTSSHFPLLFQGESQLHTLPFLLLHLFSKRLCLRLLLLDGRYKSGT